MYAIIRTGGKQYTVKPGDVIRVEKLEQALGAELTLSDVLMVGGETPAVGKPLVKNASVTVVVTKQTRDKKVIVFKKKRRHGYRRFKTHRQHFTELFVKQITLDGKSVKAETSPDVVDVEQRRKDKIAARSLDTVETSKEASAKPAKKVAAKAKTAKKSPAKKTAKKPAAKKKAAKKN